MGQAWNKVKKHRQAKNKLIELMSKAEQVILIHYSCESFYNRSNGSSPRITSIAVRNLESGQTTSFSIHQVAERQGYSAIDLEQHYDRLEKLSNVLLMDRLRQTLVGKISIEITLQP